jgi:hypothetical protein
MDEAGLATEPSLRWPDKRAATIPRRTPDPYVNQHEHTERNRRPSPKAIVGAIVALACAVGLVVSLDVAAVRIVEGIRTITVRVVPSTQNARRGVLVSVLRGRDGDCDPGALTRADGVLAGDQVVGRIDQRVSWKSSQLLWRRSSRTYSDDDRVCVGIVYADGTICPYGARLTRTARGLEATFAELWPCAAPLRDRDVGVILEQVLLDNLPRLEEAPNSGLQQTKSR